MAATFSGRRDDGVSLLLWNVFRRVWNVFIYGNRITAMTSDTSQSHSTCRDTNLCTHKFIPPIPACPWSKLRRFVERFSLTLVCCRVWCIHSACWTKQLFHTLASTGHLSTWHNHPPSLSSLHTQPHLSLFFIMLSFPSFCLTFLPSCFGPTLDPHSPQPLDNTSLQPFFS